MTAQADSTLDAWTYEHDQVLDQVLGKKAAREERTRIYESVPCVGCGATSGTPCMTVRDVPVQPRDQLHQSRRNNADARMRWHAFVLERTDEIVRARKADRQATRIVNAPTHQPTLRLRPRVTVALETSPLAVRLGDAASQLERARADEAAAWLAAERLSIELAIAEKRYADLLADASAALRSGDVDALMRGGS